MSNGGSLNLLIRDENLLEWVHISKNKRGIIFILTLSTNVVDLVFEHKYFQTHCQELSESKCTFLSGQG